MHSGNTSLGKPRSSDEGDVQLALIARSTPQKKAAKKFKIA
jgi:hypothetical protein